jgi:lysophospholipase L1-like esterase
LRRSRLIAALAVVAGIAAAAPAASHAACGGVQQEAPRKNVGPGRAPLALGDSQMLLALGDLAKRGFRANARGCRQYPEALALLRKLRREDKLPRLVVISLGGNGVVTKAYIHEALDILGKKRELALVTPLETGGIAGDDARLVREEAHKHGKRIKLLDWVEHSNGHPAWFQPDGTHLTFEGAEALAKFLKTAFSVLDSRP